MSALLSTTAEVPAAAATPRATRPAAPPTAGYTSDSRWSGNPDGSTTRTFYGGRTFRSQDGRWGPIDATVRRTGDAAFPLAAEDAIRPVLFGAGADVLVRLRLDGGEVTVSAPRLDVGTPELSADGSVLYRDVARDTDLRYHVTTEGVREELVLRSPRAPRTFRFVVNDPARALGGFVEDAHGGAASALPIGDGHRLLLGRPFAYELREGAAAADPAAVRTGFRHAPGRTEIVKSLDAGWVAGRSWPIVVDPTMTFGGPAVTTDCHLRNGTHQAQNHCASTVAEVGAAGGEARRTLLRFDLTGAPAASRVTDAALTLTQAAPYSGTTTQVELREPGQAWTTGATWLTYDGTQAWTTAGGQPGPTAVAVASVPPVEGQTVTWRSAAFTTLVKGWITDATANRGVLLKAVSETGTRLGSFAASEHATAVSRPALTLTFTGPPDAPIGLAAQRADSGATVTWTAPPSNGDPITSYRLRTLDAGNAVVGTTVLGVSATSATVTGLTNGATYTFDLVAVNSFGDSAAAVSNAVAPAALPGVPGNVDVVRGDRVTTVSWTAAPANGAAVLDYTVTAVRADTGAVAASTTAAASATQAAVTDLVNGVSYTARVVARNDVGSGAAGEAGPVTPAHVPLAPPNVSARPLPDGARVTWTAADANGEPVTGYRVTTYREDATIVDVAVLPATARSHRRYGLTNGQTYDFGVTAVNSIGTGTATRSNAVTPDLAARLTLAVDTGEVTTLAGTGTAGTADGTGTAAALTSPVGVTYLGGYAYVGTTHAIRRIDPVTEEVTTVAGGVTSTGCTNATTGAQVRLAGVGDMTTDGQYLYFLACDSVRRLTPATGEMTTVHNFGSASGVRALTYAPDGNLYVSAATTYVYRVAPATGVKTTVITLPNGGVYGLASDDTYLYWEHHYAPNSTVTRKIERWRLDGTANPETVYQEVGGNASTLDSPLTIGLGTLEIAGDYLYGRFAAAGIQRYDKMTGATTVVAGSRSAGHADGTQYDAWFGTVSDIASDGSVLYVTDSTDIGGHRVRRVAQAPARPRGAPPASGTTVTLEPGVVTTVAGDGATATTDGAGSAASLNRPRGIAYLNGYAYVGTSDAIQRVEPATGQVTTITGGVAATNCVNSAHGFTARVTDAGDMTTDGQYVYFVACDAVRRLNPATGAVSTVSSFASASQLRAIAAAPDGNLYVSTMDNWIFRIDAASGARTLLQPVSDGTIYGLAADGTYLYWEYNHAPNSTGTRRIQRWRLDGTAAPESLFSEVGNQSSNLESPYTVGLRTLELTGDYLFARGVGGTIRRYHKVTGAATVVAGARSAGHADGTEFDAWFGTVMDIASDGSVLYVADSGDSGPTGSGNRVRRVAQAPDRPRGAPPMSSKTVTADPAVVTTIAGSGTGATTGGVGTAAAFNNPNGVAYLAGYAYVGTTEAIQRVELATGQVTTVAGGVAASGCVNATDGAAARVENVGDMTTDGQYVYFLACDAIRRFSPATGAVSTVSNYASVPGLRAIAAAPDGNLYASGMDNWIYRIDPGSGGRKTLHPVSNGTIYSLAADDTYLYWERYLSSSGIDSRWIERWRLDGTSAPEALFQEFNNYLGTPTVGLRTLELAGKYLYARTGGGGLRRYDKVTGAAVTVAGWPGLYGHADGAGEFALFGLITDIATDGTNLLVVERPTSGTNPMYGNRLRAVLTDPMFDTDGEYLGWDPFAGWFEDVNPGLGNFVTTEVDAKVAGIGPKLELERTYNSADRRLGALGEGWTFEYDITWQADKSGAVAVLYSDGRRERYTPASGGGFTAPNGYHSTLTSDGNGGYVLKATDGTVRRFDASRHLTSVTDANNRTLSLAYTNGKLATVTSASGRALHFTWTGDRISAVSTDSVAAHGAALTWKYYYTGTRLTAVCDPRNNALTGKCTEYEYALGRMTRIEKPNGVTELTVGYLSDGKVQYRQDGLGNLTWFDSIDADTVEITDARGHKRRQDYDSKLRLVAETDPYDKKTTYTYDAQGHRESVSDPNQVTTSYTFDSDGNTTSITNGEGETAYTTYDSDNNVTASRDPRSTSATDDTYKTTHTYDSRRNKLSQSTPATAAFPSGVLTSWTYSLGTEPAYGGGATPPGLLLSATDGRNKTTTYAYDTTGDLREVIDPVGLITRYAYDELGRQITQTVVSDSVPAGVTTTWTYDALGNQLTQTDAAVVNQVNQVSHQLHASHVYDDNGNRVSTTLSDLTGGDESRTTVYGYDSLDRLVDTFDAQTGKSLHQTYDAAGNEDSVTDQLGRRYETEHDKNNRPVKVTAIAVIDDPVAGSAPRDLVLTRTTYDAGGRMETETDAAGRVRRFDYDDANRLTDTTMLAVTNRDATTRDIVVDRRAYDDAGQVTDIWTGGLKRHEHHVYDAATRLTSTTLDPGALDRVTTFTYDATGNVLSRSVAQDGRTEQVRFTYDNGGRMSSETVENGATDIKTGYTHDRRGLLTMVSEPRGYDPDNDPSDFRTHHQYDVLGRPVRTIRPFRTVENANGWVTDDRPIVTVGYDTFGNQTHHKDERGAVTLTAYDKIGRVVGITHPSYTPYSGGSPSLPITPTESFQYDDVGNLTQRVDRRGSVYDYDYDSRNRVVRQRDPLLTGQTLRGVQHWRYDDVGNLVEAVDQRGARTTFTYDDIDRQRTRTERVRRQGLSDATYTTTFDYDDLGNRTYERNPAGDVTTATVNAASETVSVTDPADKVWTAEHDVAGRLTASADPLGRRTERAFDLAGRMTREGRRSASGTLLGETEITYDLAGNVVAAESARDYVTTFTYDPGNQLTHISQPVDASTSIGSSYLYDIAGNVMRATVGGRTTTYKYTPWNQRERVVEPATTAHPALADRTFYTSYDAGGLPVAEYQPGATVERTFDELGRLTQEAGTGFGLTSATRTFGYDHAGLRTSVGHPDGTQAFAYDDRGLLTSALGPAGDATYSYDAAGRLVRRVDPAGEHTFTWTSRSRVATAKDPLSGLLRTFTYNDANELTAMTLPSGARRDVTYDAFGRLDTDTWKDSGNAVTYAVDYGYDADSNITSQAVTATGNPAAGTHGFGYDRSGRLTSWTKPDTTVVAYGWDGAGNRTSAGGATFTYDERNRLLTGDGATYTWTARGTLDSRTDGATTASFGFDALGRQTNAGSVSYAYDALDRLATRNVGGDVTTFSYAGASLDPSTNGDVSYGRGPSGMLLSAREGAGAAVLAALNQHGDLVGLLDANGSAATTHVYDPFGKVAGSAGAVDVGLGYQSDVTDPATGDVWMGARWYDPADGGFTARDTVFGQLSNPVTLNRYTYANASPLRFHDPDGRCGRYSGADIAAETDAEAQDLMRHTSHRDCVGAAFGQAGKRLAGTLEVAVLLGTALLSLSDIAGCVGGDGASCAWALAGVLPVGKAAKFTQVAVRAKRSAQSVKRATKALERSRAARRASTGARMSSGATYTRRLVTATANGRHSDDAVAGVMTQKKAAAAPPVPRAADDATGAVAHTPQPHHAPQTAPSTAPDPTGGRPILFGQKRIGPNFSAKDGVPNYLKNRPIADVSADLRSGKLSPDAIRIKVFEHNGQYVTTYNRGLAALSDAGMRPTNVTVVDKGTLSRRELARLTETPTPLGDDLPSTRIAVTPSEVDLSVIKIIQIADA